MSNTLFKQVRQTIVVPPPPPPPPPPRRRLVRKTGQRPKYSYFVTADFVAAEGTNVVAINVKEERVLTGTEGYDYYEWVVSDSPLPVPLPPVVTPVPPAWDATARSAITLTDSLAVEWAVNVGSADVIAGLATVVGTPSAPTGSDAVEDARRAAEMRASILHGFRVVGGVAYVHSAPPPEFGVVALEQRHPFRNVSNGSICRVEITRGVVRYLVDGELVATGPGYVHKGQGVYLRAALYGPGDLVDDPAIEPLAAGGTGEATLAPVTTRGGRYAEGSAILGLWAEGPRQLGLRRTLPPMWAKGGKMGGSASFQLAPMVAWGDGVLGNSGEANITLAPLMAKGGKYAEGSANIGMFVFGRGVEVPPQNVAVAGLGGLFDAYIDPRPHRGAYGVMGIGCTFVAQQYVGRPLLARMGLADQMRAHHVWPARFTTALGLSASKKGAIVKDVALVMGVGLKHPTIGVLVLSADFDSMLGVSHETEGERLLNVYLRAAIGLDADIGTQAFYNAVLRSVIGLSTPGMRSAGDYLVWSVEDGGASAAYSGWAFNSFARIGGRIFAASDAGLYELGGDTDDGEPIAAWVDMGQRNFGTTRLKGISNAYLTVASSGAMRVRVTTPEGDQYTYEARGSSESMMAQRVDFGRGLRATFLNLEILNDSGGDFDLDRAEFIVNETTRRI